MPIVNLQCRDHANRQSATGNRQFAMTPERWQQIKELFHEALVCDPAQRKEFLVAKCVGDEDLRTEVESLLSSLEEDESFIEAPAGDLAAELLGTHRPTYGPGHQIQNYRIERQIGSGGMGEVYLAQDAKLNRKVALKLLPPHFTVNPDRVRRFEREARAASALNHPNIVTIYEIGLSDSTHFIATEFVDGKTLRQLINEKPFTLNETVNVSLQVAEALKGAHAAGIVHRDIKPENIMIRHDGYVKILDFGLAKLTEQQTSDADLETPTLLQSNPGLVMGTVQYMSPEQARAKSVGVGTDIWSLGIVMYELLAGHVPFTGETPSHVMVSLMEDKLPPLKDHANVPDELDRFVTKTLRKSQKDRYQAAGQLAHDLKEFKQNLQRDSQLSHWLKTVPSSKDGAQLLLTPSTTVTGAHPIRVEHRTATENRPDLWHLTSSAGYLVNRIKSHKPAWALAAAVVIGATVTIAYLVHRDRTASLATKADIIDSIAILPFENVNNDPNAEFLADGISDSISNKLSRLRALKVAPFNSVMRYKGKQSDAQSIGKELKVRAVLTGRVTLQGNYLTVDAELVDVVANQRVWLVKYNDNMSGIFAWQAEISRQISEKLRLSLSNDDKTRLAKNSTQDLEAYRLYNLGMHALRDTTKEGMEKSIEYFEAAINADPNYTLAYDGLYRAYYGLGQRFYWLPKETRQKMEWAALKAVELDDTSIESHIALATIKKINWDWPGADKEYRRAVELGPDSFGTNFSPNLSYALFLMDVGRLDEAMVYAKKAEDLNPNSGAVVAEVYLYMGDYDKALEQLALKGYRASSGTLLSVYLAKGKYDEAIAATQKYMSSDDSPEYWGGYPMLAYAYARAGRRDEALKILREQHQLEKKSRISPFNFAIIYAGLDDKDRAFEYLNKACEEHVLQLSHFARNALFESLRSDARYHELLRCMKFES